MVVSTAFLETPFALTSLLVMRLLHRPPLCKKKGGRIAFGEARHGLSKSEGV